MQIPRTGLIGSEQALQQGLNSQLGLVGQGIGSAQGEIDRATAIARGDINQGYNNAQQNLSPYAAGGANAANMQAALMGVMGQEAQAQAFQNYAASPGQEYALEQGRKNLLAGASATGQLGGGNVLRELNRQGIGTAQQNFQQDFNNMGTVANRGLNVAGQQAGMNVNRGQGLAGIQQNAGANLSNLALQGGVLPAQMVGNTANQLAQGRFGVGQQLAGAASNTTNNLANLQNQLGQGMSNQFGQGNTNIGNLVSQAGQGSSALSQQLSTILSNIATGSGSSQANNSLAAGQFDAAGIMGQNQAVQNTMSQLMQLIPQGGGYNPNPGGQYGDFGGGGANQLQSQYPISFKG